VAALWATAVGGVAGQEGRPAVAAAAIMVTLGEEAWAAGGAVERILGLSSSWSWGDAGGEGYFRTRLLHHA
jgi:hypothetical protein